MKFNNYLESIAGISVYPLFSLIVFVVFFIILGWWVYGLSKEEVTRLENMPFSDGIIKNEMKDI